MNLGAALLVVLLPLVIADALLWLFLAKSVTGCVLSLGAVWASTWLYRWADWR